jgi:hypothetical protein
MNDPMSSYNFTGYVLNETNNTKYNFLCSNELTLTNKTFTLGPSLINSKNEAYNSKFNGNKVIINDNTPIIQILFQSEWATEELIKTCNLKAYNLKKDEGGTYELTNCVISEIEISFMPEKRMFAKSIKGTFESIRFIDRRYIDLVQELNYKP